MRIRQLWTEVDAGECAHVEGGHAAVFDDAEALVYGGVANVHNDGRAIVFAKGEASVRDGGRAWICKKGRATICDGGEAFAVVGSFVTVEPGGMLHMYSKKDWPEAARLTWQKAHGRAAFTFGEKEQL
jgi:hypothetical protein